MCQIIQDARILWFYLSSEKYFGTIDFCRMSQDVGLHKFHCICLILYFFHVFQVHRLVVVDKDEQVKGIVSHWLKD
jgi:hypothetical protein